MCNQSVGLIQRALEATGIATASISIVRRLTEHVRPPRAVFLRWPFGHPLGEPGNRDQQMTILKEVLRTLRTIDIPGTIVDLPYRWRRVDYRGLPDTIVLP